MAPVLRAAALHLLLAAAAASDCDECGGSATYGERISTSGKPGIGGCGGVGEEGSASEAVDQEKVLLIPAAPVIASSTTSVECQGGEIGVSLNGVSIFSAYVGGTCDLVDATALDPQVGGHSPQVGWALDGFPIYGPLGPSGVAARHSAQGCAGDYCLDDCGGIEQEFAALDAFKYRYYFTGATSDLASLPANPKPASTDYPFGLKCYAGCTWSELEAADEKCANVKEGAQETEIGATGVADDYAAAAHAGFTAAYIPAEAQAAGLTCAATEAKTPAPTPAPMTDPTSPAPTATAAPTSVPIATPTANPNAASTALPTFAGAAPTTVRGAATFLGMTAAAAEANAGVFEAGVSTVANVAADAVSATSFTESTAASNRRLASGFGFRFSISTSAAAAAEIVAAIAAAETNDLDAAVAAAVVRLAADAETFADLVTVDIAEATVEYDTVSSSKRDSTPILAAAAAALVACAL